LKCNYKYFSRVSTASNAFQPKQGVSDAKSMTDKITDDLVRVRTKLFEKGNETQKLRRKSSQP
jgi:hypothetical protein